MSATAGNPAAMRRLNKEIAEMGKTPVEGITAGPAGDNLFKWEATITGPKDTPYAGGVFFLKIDFPVEYPFKPPVPVFTTKVYHCNVNDKGGICLNILKDDYSPALTVSKILLTLQALLAAPNVEDPLSPEIANLYKTDKAKHDKTAAEWTRKYAM